MKDWCSWAGTAALEISSLEKCGFYLLLHFLNSAFYNDKGNRIVL